MRTVRLEDIRKIPFPIPEGFEVTWATDNKGEPHDMCLTVWKDGEEANEG